MLLKFLRFKNDFISSKDIQKHNLTPLILQVDLKTSHEKSYTNISINGRVPAIVDPNTSLTLWESWAILDTCRLPMTRREGWAAMALMHLW